jgi:Flp pilus assembly protein TadG
VSYNHRNMLKGQAMVEFALLLPILLIILVGILEFALFLNSYLIVQSTARDVVRQISVGLPEAAVIQTSMDNARGIDRTRLTITISPGLSQRTRGTPVSATLRYDHRVITPFIGPLIGGASTYEIRATMRME